MNSSKRNFAVCFALASMAFSACDDSISMVGTTVQPPSDLITVYTDTFTMKASTVMMDSVYAKTTNCMIGEMYDPIYGHIKSDFLCQFYCEEGYQFAHTPYEGKIDSVKLLILYPGSSWYGDSLTPMRVTVYPIDKELKANYYTNDNIEYYCDMDNPLGSTAYTAYDMTISDSVRSARTYDYDTIKIDLPRALGEKFYKETIENPSSFASQENFNKFFPGLYITTTFGNGNLIYTKGENLEMRIYYNYMATDTAGLDSLAQANAFFATSKEVIQLNRMKNSNIDQLLVENGSYTYIKSPAGVCTKLEIPTTEISKALDVSDRYINNFTLNLHYLPEDEWDFAYTPPDNLLLIQEDSIKSFFENGDVENSTTSFLSHGGSGTSASTLGYNATQRMYYFGNVSSLLKSHMENNPDKDLSLLVIPVTREVGTSSYTTTTYYTTGISNCLVPSGVKIRIDNDYMKVVVVSSKFENK